MKRERAGLAVCVAAILVMAAAATGCRTGGSGGNAGTSTGLPYRPPGTPTYSEVPPGFRTFPAAEPLGK